MANEDQVRELEEKYEGYTVYDRDGDKIGKVDDLFIDDADREEYIGVKMGLFGLGGTTLIPLEVVRVDDRNRSIEVGETKEHVKDAPNFGDDDDITPEYEDRIRRHFGLESRQPSPERGSYDRRGQQAGETAGTAGTVEGTEGDRVGSESYQSREGMGSESAMESAGAGRGAEPTGGVADLETGERDRAGNDDAYREGYLQGLREARGDVEPSEEETTRRDQTGGREGYPERGAAERSDAPMTSSGGALGPGSMETTEEAPTRREELSHEPVGEGGRREDFGPSGPVPGDTDLTDVRRSEETTGPGERGADRGRVEDASEHAGAPAAGPGDKEFDDMQDYQSATTGFQPGGGAEPGAAGGPEERRQGSGGPMDRGDAAGQTREGERSPDEGEEEESAPARVWRRIRR